MAIPWGAAIGAAGSLLGNYLGKNADQKYQSQENKKNRDHEINMWNMNNTYNTPLEQMKRLKAGGVNPHVAYGNGSIVNTSSPVGKPNYVAPPPKDLGGTISGGIQTMYDLTTKDKQNDLMEVEMMHKFQQMAESAKRMTKTDADIDKTRSSIFKDRYQEANLWANTKNAEARTESEKQKLSLAQGLENSTLQFAQERLRNMELQNAEKELSNSQLPEKHKVAIMEAYARIKNLQQNTDKSTVDEAIQKEILQLKKIGIEASDSFIFRVLGKGLNALNESGTTIGQKFKNWIWPTKHAKKD